MKPRPGLTQFAGCHAIPLLVVTLAGVLPGPAAAMEWFGRATIQQNHTSSLFPGYIASTPDNYTTLTGALAGKAVIGSTQIEAATSAALERYARWSGHDLERYQARIDTRTSGLRLQLRGTLEPDVLLYPDTDGDARYRGREGVVGLEYRPVKRLRTGIELRSESQRYDTIHSGRDSQRTRWGYSIAWLPGSGSILELAWENERSNARSSNYDFRENEVTLAAEHRFPWLRIRGEVSPGLRNYFTGSLFASNYRRQDRKLALRLRLDRPLARGLEVELRNEFRHRESTRPDRDYDQNTLELGLLWTVNP